MVDIGGTAKKIQKMARVAEESYKKMNQMLQEMQELQQDMETTSQQVDTIEDELAEQRTLLEALAREQGVDVEEVLEAADLSPDPAGENTDGVADPQSRATSRPSATEDT